MEDVTVTRMRIYEYASVVTVRRVVLILNKISKEVNNPHERIGTKARKSECFGHKSTKLSEHRFDVS